MALIQPDFSDIRDEVGPGTYKCLVKGAEVKAWPSGEPYVAWTLETWGEPEPKNNGRRIFHKTSVSGKAAFRLQQFYKAATGQTLNPEKPSFDTEQLLGAKLEVVLVDGMKEGQPTGYVEVKQVRPVVHAN